MRSRFNKYKIDLVLVIILIFFYLFLLYLSSGSKLKYQFDESLIDNYLHSQDMVENIEGRVFISDDDIYIASGYLYATGSDPTKYNFPHPPLVKYLLGYSTIYLNNPYYTQLFFGISVLVMTFVLGILFFKKRSIAFLASLLLIIDPAFREMSISGLLDLGQTSFSLGYLISALFLPQMWLLQGVILGLFAASKFWSTVFLFVVVVYFYKIYINKEKWNRRNTYSFITAVIAFSVVYTRAFVVRDGAFNILFHQLKMLKFMIQHNSATNVGGSLILFLTGYFNSWWGDEALNRSTTWTVIWPFGFLSLIYNVFRGHLKKAQGIIVVIPLLYFVITLTQVPFARYFVIVLPYVYLSLSYTIVSLLTNRNIK